MQQKGKGPRCHRSKGRIVVEPWGFLFAGLTATQQTAAQSALQQWANVASINFVASQDDAFVIGDIRFARTDNVSLTEQAHAYAPFPGGVKGGF